MSSRRAWQSVSLAAATSLAAVAAAMLGPAAPALATCRPAGPDAYVTNRGDGTVSVINNCAAVIATIGVGNAPSGIALSPGGGRAYVANSNDGTLSVIDTASGKVTDTIGVASFPDGFADGVAVSPDGTRVYVADEGDQTVAVVNTATDKLVDTIALGDSPFGLAVSPDSAKLYVADNTAIKVIDTTTDLVTGTIKVAAEGVVVSPDGSTIYAEDALDNVSVIDSATGAVVGTIPNLDSVVEGDAAPNILTLSPDGGTLYQDDQAFNLLKVFDTSTDSQSNSIPVGTAPDSVATADHGVFDYVANAQDATVSKINANAAEVVNTIPVGNTPFTVATVPPRPGHAGGIWLNGLSCLSGAFCLAVGTRAVAAGTAGFAEVRSRGRWRVTEPAGLPGSTDDALYQVSCRTATNCVAVGTADARPASGGPVKSVPLADKWNGRGWTASQPPAPSGSQGSELRDVSCGAGPVCLAVGSYANAAGQTVPLSERWTGRKWQVVPVPDPALARSGMLTGVSCAGSRCAAVGTYSTSHARVIPLAENLRSGHWHVAPMPVPGPSSQLAVRGVSCGSGGVCLAVGYLVPRSGRRVAEPFTERLAAGRWHLLARAALTPADTALDAISCLSTNRCLAVGGTGKAAGQSPFAQGWNGTKWLVLKAPGPVSPTRSGFSHVSCHTTRSCVAVGNDGIRTLAEMWNGSMWRTQSTPSP